MRHPEAEYVRKTFVLRKMDFPPEVSLTKKSMLRWVALSLGLISENESRSTVIDIMDLFFTKIFAEGKNPGSQEIQEELEGKGLKVSEKLVRYHLNKMCEIGFLSHAKGRYSLNPAPDAERNDLAEAFSYWYKRELDESVNRVGTALTKLQAAYENK